MTFRKPTASGSAVDPSCLLPVCLEQNRQGISIVFVLLFVVVFVCVFVFVFLVFCQSASSGRDKVKMMLRQKDVARKEE